MNACAQAFFTYTPVIHSYIYMQIYIKWCKMVTKWEEVGNFKFDQAMRSKIQFEKYENSYHKHYAHRRTSAHIR